MCLKMALRVDKVYRRPLTLDRDQINLPRDKQCYREVTTYLRTSELKQNSFSVSG